MKGFPNQIADLGKLAQGLRAIVQLLDSGQNPKDDGVLGEALVRAGMLGTGHTPIPVEQYLRAQSSRPHDRQSFRTSARGLRELYRLLGLIIDNGPSLVVTPDGHQIASFSGTPLDTVQIELWRRLILNFRHQGGDPTASHPYQVLLRLIARKPGITRAKCALALEARDDSPQELERIVALADLPESTVLARINVSKSNWDNAKKVIPRFAEQLGDAIKTGQTFRLADAPGRGGGASSETPTETSARATPRRPRSSREVTPETIGTAGMADRAEPAIPPNLDPQAALEANRIRADRLRRHNMLVRALATRLATSRLRLYEDPFDIFGVEGSVGILVEVKTLDGTDEDERERVRDAFGQLFYYEAFVTPAIAGRATIHKVACFEQRISEDHQRWLSDSGIATIWRAGEVFTGNSLAARILRRYIEELT